MRNKINHTIETLVMTGLLFCTGLMAQDASVKASMDSVAMLIGHQSKLTLELTKPADADIAFPLILDTLVNKVEVVQRGEIDTTFISDERQLLTQELLITSFDSGFYYIPPFEFEIQPGSGGGILETDPLVLKIYTYQIDTIAGIFDIKPIKKVRYTFAEILPYLLWWLSALILALIAVMVYLRWKNNKPIFASKPKPQEPPYILAFRELERIRSEKLWQKNKEKQFYTDLTDTLRTYLEGRYKVLAMEQTSDEILTDIKALVPEEHFKNIEDTLRLADLVKFAKMKPLMDESERCIKLIYRFVDETKRLPESEDEGNEENEEKKETIEPKTTES